MTKLNKTELAESFGVSTQTVDAWLRRGLPHEQVAGPGRPWQFSLPAVIAWKLQQEIERHIASNGGPLDLTQERARLAKAQADKVERELEIMGGKLIPADQVEKVWSGMVTAFRARMLAMPSTLAAVLAAELDPRAAEAMLRSAVNEALSELAEYDPAQYADVTQ